ncbi:MAG TPA: PorV/PorQ family protein [Bacteroidia bacterium]|nr:PorV/PorQ family protein [Bacteroidia bacterium]
MISNNRLRFRVFSASILIAAASIAGNSDRAGQAGGTQLLINPFTRSSGWGSANSASISGLEAQFLNVAGVAHTEKTELLAARTNWLVGTGISINSFGFSQKLGNASALAFGVMAMDFGDINVTTVEQPEGNIGTFKPQFLNLNLSYAKEFSNSIFGGLNVKVISENIANLKASGVCFDGGIQYVTSFGKDKELNRKNVHFGISLKNVGPQVKYQGDGISAKANLTSTGAAQTLEFRSQAYDLPSLVNIGASYDYYLSKENNNQRITAALNFTSNSFTQDQFNIGFEYGYKQMFMLRAGMVYEKGIFNAEDRKTALTGPTAGFSADLPLGKESKRKFGVEYAYRTTNPFAGIHTIGLRLKL